MSQNLQHHGVKGMKWGVRRTAKKVSNRIGETRASLKRERSWRKVVPEIDKMSKEKVKSTLNRIRMENDFKKLTKTKVATGKDKKDYRTRAKLDDKKLKDKVETLRNKDLLRKQIAEATKSQRQVGKAIADLGSAIFPTKSAYINLGKSVFDKQMGSYE